MVFTVPIPTISRWTDLVLSVLSIRDCCVYKGGVSPGQFRCWQPPPTARGHQFLRHPWLGRQRGR